MVLLNPGPVNVHDDVRAAIAAPDSCHREPEAAALIDRVRAKATTVAGGDDSFTSVVLAGSGTAALEAVFSSVVPANGRILILDNGHYADRITRIVDLHRIPYQRLEFGWTHAIDLAEVDRVLADDPSLTHVALVHHETSTGQLNPLREVGEIVARHRRSLAVDAISSLGSEKVDVYADHIDWLVSTANKNLEALPGSSIVTARHSSFTALADVAPHTFYLDLHAHYRAQEHEHAPLFTPALQVLASLDAALDRTLDEGVQARGKRYAALAQRIREGLRERGATFLLDPEHQANSVTNVYLPSGISYLQLHDALKERGYVIYSTQAQLDGLFRVANMGQLTDNDITGFLHAYDDALTALSQQLDVEVGA
ncbi:aminotransferase class V-fold PLP-dependent enzyme [Gordonia sp. ABSL11-1]|uniref:pyridoxal-phosphate-dependent aminotransferase family protein n=1 Tax=Gordonia sp. ABSL11-1 TaxID=3053924 RepID=UPI002573A12C|nr:aminotransferase class V-fold PLP-dependent enzyme [Gordonia sp. ABSL11-1]MDL9947215.1 aminotransferase class V-fold PLP-dependent enzyme [Gordonia sp. ABSL11-1]